MAVVEVLFLGHQVRGKEAAVEEEADESLVTVRSHNLDRHVAGDKSEEVRSAVGCHCNMPQLDPGDWVS